METLAACETSPKNGGSKIDVLESDTKEGGGLERTLFCMNALRFGNDCWVKTFGKIQTFESGTWEACSDGNGKMGPSNFHYDGCQPSTKFVGGSWKGKSRY